MIYLHTKSVSIFQLHVCEQRFHSRFCSYLLELTMNIFAVIEPLSCVVEVLGCVPKFSSLFSNDVKWVCDLLSSTKEELRELASLLYAIIICETYDEKEFGLAVNHLITQTGSKSLEAQHGAISGIASALERKIMLQKSTTADFTNWELYQNCISTIGKYFKHILLDHFFCMYFI